MLGLNLATLNTRSAANEGAWLHLDHPQTGEPLYADEERSKPCRIRLLGADSDQFKRLANKLSSERMSKAMSRRGKLTVQMDRVEEDKLDVLCECTVLCENLAWGDAPVLAEDKQALRRMYQDAGWIADQVDDFMNERANFLGNGSTSSSSGPE